MTALELKPCPFCGGKADSCQRVAVKPLVWEHEHMEGWVFARGGVLQYAIMLSVNRVYGVHGEHDGAAQFPTFEAAKAAAQADYEARILSAIDMQPDPRDAVIARLVEAANKIKRLRCITPAARDASWMNYWSGALDDLGKAAAKGFKLAD